MTTCLTTAPDQPSLETIDSDPLTLAFGLGWAAADEAQLPALPESLAQILGVPAARLAVLRWDGTALLEHAFPSPEERAGDGPLMLYELDAAFGTEYTLRLSLESPAELTPAQSDTFAKAQQLILTALDCILIRQNDRLALGEPFAHLSDREWQICLALERTDGEKQIATSLSCSRHTVHSYVKSLYRKLQVQSRLQVLDHLKRAREQLRRRTLDIFGAPPPRPN